MGFPLPGKGSTKGPGQAGRDHQLEELGKPSMWLEGLSQGSGARAPELLLGQESCPGVWQDKGLSGARSSATARSWPNPINHAFRAALQAPVCLRECLEALQHLAA